jgi:uncharacterized protein (TIGR00369 family)
MTDRLIDRVLAADTALLDHFGCDVVEVSVEKAVLSGAPSPALANSVGVVHGSYAFALMDTAAAYALAAREIHAVTVGSHVSYARPVAVGAEIEAEARVQTAGRTLATVRSELTVDGGIAAIGTFEFVVRRHAV